MDWLKTINNTTEYIEEHIGDKIDFEDFSKSINVSYFYLLKMFKTITNVGLKEYVKNRRLSVSCYDLLNTDNNILDIAIKYGYNSNEAFTRAFKTFHGVTPKEVRTSNMLLRQYPMIHFNVSSATLEEVKFDIITNYEITLYGKKIRFYEDHSIKNIRLIESFIREMENTFKDEITYTTKTNYHVEDFPTYDLFIGVKNNAYDYLDTFKKKVNKVIIYKATGNHPLSLKLLKQRILDEWTYNSLEFNQELELEYIYKDGNNYQIEYVVSIN